MQAGAVPGGEPALSAGLPPLPAQSPQRSCALPSSNSGETERRTAEHHQGTAGSEIGEAGSEPIPQRRLGSFGIRAGSEIGQGPNQYRKGAHGIVWKDRTSKTRKKCCITAIVVAFVARYAAIVVMRRFVCPRSNPKRYGIDSDLAASRSFW